MYGLSGLTWTDIRHIGTPRNALIIDGETVEIPIPEPGDERLLPEVNPAASGDYTFMNYDAGEPVRWDPCRSVYYVINPEGAPPGSEDLIFDAVTSVQDATGLYFVYEGHTSEPATFDRDLIQEQVYGERFVPLVIGWATEMDDPVLEGSVAGMGGSSVVNGAYGDQRYLTGGVVILDARDLHMMMASQNQKGLALAVIMHELGHVVGLDHVEDTGELMNPTNSSLDHWGPGDLEGLAIAGKGPCQTV